MLTYYESIKTLKNGLPEVVTTHFEIGIAQHSNCKKSMRLAKQEIREKIEAFALMKGFKNICAYWIVSNRQSQMHKSKKIQTYLKVQYALW